MTAAGAPPPTSFRSWLARERVVSARELQAAAARQAVYGGTLDTALLESGVLSETALWARLAAATGLPVPAPGLCDGTESLPESAAVAAVLAAEQTGPLGAVPVAVDATGTALKILCRESAPVEAIRAEAARQGFEARLYVVPEVRLLAMRQRVYGERMPARYASLLARLLGPARARTGFLPARAVPERRALPPPPPPPPPPRPPEPDVDRPLGASPMILMPDPASGPLRLEAVPESVGAGDSTGAATEVLCRRARDRNDKGRLLAARTLRRRLEQPIVAELMAVLRAQAADEDTDHEVAVAAIETLTEARDAAAVPVLIERLGRKAATVVAAAHTGLVALCATDLGTSRRRWTSWARKNLGRPRVEWLLEGLAHKQPEIRMAAAAELRLLAGDSFGYLFDLPKREREKARKRFVAWWEERQK